MPLYTLIKVLFFTLLQEAAIGFANSAFVFLLKFCFFNFPKVARIGEANAASHSD